MPRVAFHFNVPSLPDYLCRLLKKATAAGHRAWVLCPESQLETLDALLWTFSQQEFIGHTIAAPEAASLMKRSAVVLSDAEPLEGDGWTLLVNTLPRLPQGIERFERVVELVTHDEALKAAARQRWRQYREAGLEIEQHDVAQLAR